MNRLQNWCEPYVYYNELTNKLIIIIISSMLTSAYSNLLRKHQLVTKSLIKMKQTMQLQYGSKAH